MFLTRFISFLVAGVLLASPAFADETLGDKAVAALKETLGIQFDQEALSRWGKKRCTLPTGKMTNMQIPWKIGCGMWEDPENAIQFFAVVYDPARKQESINGFALWNWKTFNKDNILSTEHVKASSATSILLENHRFEWASGYKNYAVIAWPSPEAVGGNHLMLVFSNPKAATKDIHAEAREIIQRMTFGGE
ncbi:hypothetical protein A3D62_01595 [Candidatus Kaiserbacteria bacterium RIFCSPHIGHO2_02_FULL_49_11]|uniref:DUF3558 domain-containing protein n=1 Tax=Candidatus Kaiserbacteria bacterium RIFCSPHIGHO2_02_FULL_49_11 TaxID=1798489 RepID=A0A1F6D1I1_9BACT|nr:MAG: hypothetical protein A3D62_01595 [Candidatus Kaiserbacteria bacterium RIFCSPHIGHO2_02_FULL_49_11]